MKTVIYISLAVLLSFCFLLTSDCGDNKDSIFHDKNLERAIRAELGISKSQSISPTDLLAITKLDLNNEGIEDLSGLEYCGNLTELYLQSNKISDLLPLSTLTRLDLLDLQNNKISDLSPLSTLTSLRSLNLQSNEISDISPLLRLNSLIVLYLGYNPLSPTSFNKYIVQLEQKGVLVSFP